MRIGLMGGSFDPVHYGHLRAADWSLEAFRLDEVRLVPAGQSPFKGPCAASAVDRLAMLALAVSDHDSIRVEDCELRRDPPSYTVDTLRALAQREPEAAFTLILGSDAAAGLDSWRQVEEVRRLVEIEILVRPGEVDAEISARAHVFEGLAVSATSLRNAVRAGRSIRYLTPESVRHYIEEKGLYK